MKPPIDVPATPIAPGASPDPSSTRFADDSLPRAVWGFLRTPIRPGGRAYIAFGWMILALLLFQGLTGVLLSFYYEPSANGAAASVRFIMTDVSFGWLVRGLHDWTATLIMVLAFAQLVRVLLVRSYRGRAWSWYLGFTLLVLLLTQGFTGSLLPWDNDAFWTATSALQPIEKIPAFGPSIASIIRGGPQVAGHTVARIYALHALLLPAAALTVVALNLWILARRRRQERGAKP